MAEKRDSSSTNSSEEKRGVDPYDTALLDESKADGGHDDESHEPKLKYPKSVFFIIVNEFCERFSFYGLRTLLAIYMSTILGFSDDTATVVYHTFVMLCYFFPVFGAIIADSLLGKFKTIIYLSFVFAIGNITLTMASADQAIPGMPAVEISMLGLFLIAVGTGGIKPCIASFGGDQFIVPQQQAQLERFFSIYYFTINAGSFISTFLTPILREDVKCFGATSCYPLAFGVPAVLMVTSIIVFLLGKSFYIIKKPSGNIIGEIFKVIWYALRKKGKKGAEKKEHWLDHAENKFGKKSVTDIKLLLRVLFLYIPLPVFWALYDQQGSRWTFQATRMDGDVGGWRIKAEQLQVVNPLLILAFVPLFDIVIYPLLAKCNILTKPLQRLGLGGILAGLSFLISAFVELSLEPTYAVVPKVGEAQLRFYNTFNCAVNVSAEIPGGDSHIIEALGLWEVKDVPVKGDGFRSLRVVMYNDTCGTFANYQGVVTFSEETATSHMITNVGTDIAVKGNLNPDDVDKTKDAEPKIRIIYDFLDPSISRDLELTGEGTGYRKFTLNDTQVGTDYEALAIARYSAKIGSFEFPEHYDLEVGAVYSLLITETSANVYVSSLHVITNPNSVHMLWLLPQYFVMTAGEVMYSVTGVQFSFTQAPVSMKAVIQAAWLITIAVGNLIVVIIAEAKIFDSQMYEFLLFAGLMFLDMVIFAAMAWNYKYVDLKEEDAHEIKMDSKKASISEGEDNDAFAGERL